MLADVSGILASENLSIESVTTDLSRRSLQKHATNDFCVEANCVTTTPLDAKDVQKLVHKLETLKNDLGLDTLDIRVQRLSGKREE